MGYLCSYKEVCDLQTRDSLEVEEYHGHFTDEDTENRKKIQLP